MWDVKYLPEALDDLDELDGSQRKLVLKSIEKVRKNPLSQQEGGYGKLLGKKRKYGFNWVLENQIKSIWTKVGI